MLTVLYAKGTSRPLETRKRLPSRISYGASVGVHSGTLQLSRGCFSGSRRHGEKFINKTGPMPQIRTQPGIDRHCTSITNGKAVPDFGPFRVNAQDAVRNMAAAAVIMTLWAENKEEKRSANLDEFGEDLFSSR